jgi:uroporphyrin-III C-methyltransferase
VGAGPGSPDLLTIAAHRIISDPSSLVIVDRLVSAEILDLVRGEIKIANKHPGCANDAQMEIYDWCKEGVMAGRHVVRLKIGDPFVFGRGGEEVIEFRDFGVEPSVVPGVSAAFSAPLLGSIPVTHRGVSNQVVMCTGYGRDGTSPDLIRYHPEQTVVFLMAVGRLRGLCRNLVDLAGYPEDTPVAIVERAGCPDQRTVVGTVGTIPDVAERYGVRPPSTIVVGDVVNVLLTDGDFAGEEDEDEDEDEDGEEEDARRGGDVVVGGIAKEAGMRQKRRGRGLLVGQPIVD